MSNFNLDDIEYHTILIPKKIPEIKIENSKEIFKSAFEYYLGIVERKLNWKNGYDEICEWLNDNKNKGLLLLGNCSLGKTFITRYVLPGILLKYLNIHLQSYDLKKDDIDNILTKKICSIDDIGTEEIRIEYGNKREPLFEIVDNAEKNSNLLIITTNLTGEEIKKRYGLRVYERLLAITRRIIIKGESERN